MLKVRNIIPNTRLTLQPFARSFKSRKEISIENKIQEQQLENTLISYQNPISSIQNILNPAMIRLFLRSQKIDSPKSKIPIFIPIAQKYLKILNENFKLIKYDDEIFFSRSPIVESERQKACSGLKEIVPKLKEDEEILAVTSLLYIFHPYHNYIWYEFDKLILNKVDQSNLLTQLYSSYPLIQAVSRKTITKDRIQAPKKFIQTIIYRKDKYPKENVFLEFFNRFPVEPFIPLGVSEVADSQSVEVLSLLYQLIHFNQEIINESTKKQKIYEDLTDISIKVLSTLPNHVKIMSFSDLWKIAPSLNLPNSYMIYNLLYLQVRNSLISAPLQLFYFENLAYNILQSMLQSKFQSALLIDKIQEIIETKGMIDRDSLKLNFFDLLVQLNADTFAIKILANSTESSIIRIDSRSNNQTKISNEGKARLHEYFTRRELSAPSSSILSRVRALVITMMCFNNEAPNSQYSKLIEHYEMSIIPDINRLPLHVCLALYHNYAAIGRINPLVFAELDKIINLNQNKLNFDNIEMILWIYGKLALNPNPEFIRSVVSRYIGLVKSNPKNRIRDYFIRTIWSLVIIPNSNLLEVFTELEGPFYFSLSKFMMKRHIILMQAQQIYLELIYRYGNLPQFQKLKGILSDSSVKDYMNETKDIAISKTQQNISDLLRDLGVEHEYEKVLSNQYLVDIFIPFNVPGQSFTDAPGIVIEYDGPFHFDSLGQVSFLDIYIS